MKRRPKIEDYLNELTPGVYTDVDLTQYYNDLIEYCDELEDQLKLSKSVEAKLQETVGKFKPLMKENAELRDYLDQINSISKNNRHSSGIKYAMICDVLNHFEKALKQKS